MNNVTLSQKTKLFWIVGILSVVALALYVGMRIGRADADVIRPKESSTQNTDEQNIVSRPVNGEVQTLYTLRRDNILVSMLGLQEPWSVSTHQRVALRL